MNEEIYGVVVFKSTHHTIQAEDFFKARGISFKTIPTPREITRSCGLAIIFQLDDLDMVEDMVKKEEVIIDGVYKYIKSKEKSQAEKIF